MSNYIVAFIVVQVAFDAWILLKGWPIYRSRKPWQDGFARSE